MAARERCLGREGGGRVLLQMLRAPASPLSHTALAPPPLLLPSFPLASPLLPSFAFWSASSPSAVNTAQNSISMTADELRMRLAEREAATAQANSVSPHASARAHTHTHTHTLLPSTFCPTSAQVPPITWQPATRT
eukprot:639011-Rhodomonas_salina.1